MTYVPHILLSFGGDLPGGEIWACGMRTVWQDGPNTSADRKAWATTNLPDAVSAVEGLVTNSAAKLSTVTKLRYVKFNPIGPDGKYEDASATIGTHLDDTAIVSGGGGGAFMPWQVACVATMLTDAARGRGSKGRMFLPALAMSVNPDLLIGSAAAIGLATTVAAFVHAIAGLDAGTGHGTYKPAILSSIGDPGPTNVITSVSVDERLDVQRRRGNHIVAPRHVAAP